jgi:peptidoglycan/xylan/chitin deacetylase (PgdA/CDA1 family)
MPGIILMYHRVAALRVDPHELAVHPEHFTEHVDHLGKTVDVVRLPELRRRKGVVLTFDDGYHDNFMHARPVLSDAGLPATFFLVSGWLGAEREYWWDRLEHLLLEAEPATHHVELQVAGRRMWADIRTAGGRLRTYWALYQRLRSLSLGQIDPVLAELALQLRVSPAARGTYRIMSRKEAVHLSSDDLFDIGAHTVSHAPVVTLPLDMQVTELVGSRKALERCVGANITSFSFPYGGPAPIPRQTTRLLREAGYERACTTMPGHVGRWTNSMRLPHFNVGNWSRAEFASRLSAWLQA